MGSAVLSFMLFVGILLVLRSLIFGVIPYLHERKRKKKEEQDNSQDQKE